MSRVDDGDGRCTLRERELRRVGRLRQRLANFDPGPAPDLEAFAANNDGLTASELFRQRAGQIVSEATDVEPITAVQASCRSGGRIRDRGGR